MFYRGFLLFSLLFTAVLSQQLLAAKIEVGTEYEIVIHTLGDPDGELSLGSKKILTYGQAKITLRDDKVTSVSSDIEALLAERAETQEAIAEKRDAGLVNFRGQWVTPDKRAIMLEEEAQARERALQTRREQQQAKEAQDSRGKWLTNFAQASQIARAENKKLLLSFVGSDWCGWCIKLNEEVFSKKAFIDYAKDNYVLVQLDFPKRTPQPSSVTAQNKALAEKYRVRGFPTVIVLEPSGKFYKKGGYVRGGPKAFLKSIR